jgi:ABC-2 type transport system permease protein
MGKLYWIEFYTLLRKEVWRFMRLWTQTLLPPAITMALYFVIFGSLVGSQIRPINGYSYMQYIAPGLIMMSMIVNAYNNTVISFYMVRFQKSIEEILVSPMPNVLVLLAYVLGGVLRALITGILVTLLALYFTDLQIHHLGVILLTAFLTAALFSLAGFINGMIARSFDDISIVPTFVLTPLTYFGGVFYSIAMLSPLWQKISLFNPILYMVNAFRYGILGITDIPIVHALVVMSMLVILLFLTCIYMLNKGVGIRS